MINIIFIISLSFSLYAKENSVKLYDDLSGDLITNKRVDIITKNTIQCITDPCPSNEMTTPMSSNAEGIIKLKYSNDTFDGKRTVIRPNGYHPQRYTAVKSIKGEVALSFKPISLTKDDLRIEIIPRNKNTSFEGKKIIFTSNKECNFEKCQEILYETKINSLNIIYYPYSKVFPNGLAQTEPIYLIIKGYSPMIRYQHWRDPIKLD
jgi:hypothetical protein